MFNLPKNQIDKSSSSLSNSSILDHSEIKILDILDIQELRAAGVPKSVVRGSETEQIDYACGGNSNEVLVKHLVTKERLEKIPQADLNKLLARAAEWANNLNLTKKLVEAGADINAKNFADMNSLHYAAQHNNEEIAEFLIENSAEVNKQCYFGKTPLHYTAGNPNANIANLLIKNGASVDVPDNKGKTPLYYATDQGNLEVSKILIKNGATPNYFDTQGASPLHYVAYNGNGPIAEYLVESGANPKAQNLDGYQPIHCAARNGKLRMVQFFAKLVDIDGSDNNGKTALIHAVEQKSHEMVKLLIENKANVNVRDNNGKTALIHAVNRIVENGDDITKASLLLDNGASLYVTDKDGNNVSHQILSKYFAQPNHALEQLCYRTLECREALTQENNQGKTPCDLLLSYWKRVHPYFLEQIVSVVKAPEDNIENLKRDALWEYFLSAIQPRTKSARNVEESTPPAQQKVSKESEEVVLAGEGDSDN